MRKKIKQLADISLFQSLEQGNGVHQRHTVVDPFASSRDVSVQNVDMTLSMLARGIEPNPTLQKLLGILNQLGSLGLAEKTLQGFQASSIKSVIDALIYGIGDTNLLRKAGINVSEKAEKPAEAGKPAPAEQTATAPKEPETSATKSPETAKTPAKTDKGQKVKAAPVTEEPQDPRAIKKEYTESAKEFEKLDALCKKYPDNQEYQQKRAVAGDRYRKAIKQFNSMK